METIEIGDGAVVVVYDGRTGAIRHIHEEITLRAGRQSAPEELMQLTLDIAHSLASSELGHVKTLFISGEELRTRDRFTVNVDKRRLIPKPPSRA